MNLFTRLVQRTVCVIFFAAVLIGMGACSDAGDLIELGVNPPEAKPIDITRTGVNNFFNESGFGSNSEQFLEIRDTLGLKYVRVLLAWTDDVQPTPSSEVNYGFFDRIFASIPPGVDVLVVLAHTPSWMTDSSNWTGSAINTWVERWVRPTVAHYRNTPGIVGYEVWNEPDLTVVPSDKALQLENSPENYAELQRLSSIVIRSLDSRRKIVMGATKSIQQDFPNPLNYNKKLRDLGVEGYVDIWGIHYYGKQFESFITRSGVKDFMNSLQRPIWLTESGKSGPSEQLDYVQTVWPFLRENVPGIDRIYYYQFASRAALSDNYGLKTGDASAPVSDLYVYLREQAAGGGS